MKVVSPDQHISRDHLDWEGALVEVPINAGNLGLIVQRIPQGTFAYVREFIMEAVEVYIALLDVQESVGERLKCVDQEEEAYRCG